MTSVFSNILIAIKTRLDALNVPIAIRKRAILLEGDRLPCIVISPAQETLNMEMFTSKAVYDYSVNVTLISAGNRVYEPDVFTWLDLRESLRNLLFQVDLPGSVTVFDTTISLNPALEVVSGASSNYDVAGIVVTYRSFENRIS